MHGAFSSKTSTNKNLYLYKDAILLLGQRRLNPAYQGPCMRVQRTSDNAQLDLYFKGDDLDMGALNIFKSATTRIITWYDQSGNGNNATQSTIANAPDIILANIPINSNNVTNQEHKPSINFGGPDSATSQWLQLPSGFLNQATRLSFFISWLNYTRNNGGVFGPLSTNSVGLEIVQANIISRPALLRINAITRNDNAADSYKLSINRTPASPQVFQHELSTVIGDNFGVKAYRNGVPILMTNITAMPALNYNGIYSIGRYNAASNHMVGRIQEIVCFNRNVSERRVTIEKDIMNYYGLKVNKWY
jgi:hypothetical protein